MGNVDILALGGVQETGKNLYVVEIDEAMFILDCGRKYPSQELYGVDYVVPDFTYLIENANRIKGIFLTHAHDDHIAALPYLLKYINVPVYGSNFTISVAKELLIENGLKPDDYTFFIVDQKKNYHFDKTLVKFIRLNHSVPESLAIAIKSPKGYIVYTGNFNFDQNGKDLYYTDFNALSDVSKDGVLALLCESIGSVNDTNRSTIVQFEARLRKIFRSAEGRIVCSLFSTNLQRIQEICNLAVEHGKKIAIIGRKTQKIVNIAMNMGYLKVPEESLVNLRYIDDKNKNNSSDLVVLVTGERHEPYFMLQRMCRKVDRLVHIEPQDTVIVLTRPAIGTEKMAAKTLDMVFRASDHVTVMPNNLLLSASSGREEVKEMINILHPKHLFPVVGEYRHQYNLLSIADCLEMDLNNVHILDLGDKVTFKDGKYEGFSEKVPFGDVLIDGKGLGDLNNAVIHDRELMASSGVVMLIANINPKTRKVLSGPEFVVKGFIMDDEDKQEFSRIFNDIIGKYFTQRFINWVELKNDLKFDLSKYILKKSKSNPIIVPVVISTEF